MLICLNRKLAGEIKETETCLGKTDMLPWYIVDMI